MIAPAPAPSIPPPRAFVAVVLRPKTPSARTVETSMSVNEVTIKSPQTDLLSPRGVMLRPPLSVCWRVQTLEIDPSSREIDKISGLLGIQKESGEITNLASRILDFDLENLGTG